MLHYDRSNFHFVQSVENKGDNYIYGKQPTHHVYRKNCHTFHSSSCAISSFLLGFCSWDFVLESAIKKERERDSNSCFKAVLDLLEYEKQGVFLF